MKQTLAWMLILGLALMAGLGFLRVPFARRFWVNARRLGYIYVGLIVLLAAATFFFGVHL